MLSVNLSPEEKSQLLQAAREVMSRAHAPYSRVRVGAAVLTAQGRVWAGCNVENSSYGLTICAERAAICQAVAGEGGARLVIRAIAVVSDRPGPFSPCGACRQVIFEFGPKALVIFKGPEGLEEQAIQTLLPYGFALE
jgi:cytidine deaminase